MPKLAQAKPKQARKAKPPCQHGYMPEGGGWHSLVEPWGSDPRYGRCRARERRLVLDRWRRPRKAQPVQFTRTRRAPTPAPSLWEGLVLA